MKKNILLILFLCCCGKMLAQQEAVFAQYHLNRFLINPAAAGANDLHTIYTNLRFQWTGLANSPKTGLVSYNAPLGKVGLGATIFSDQVASLHRFGANFAYAYRMKIKKNTLAIGMAGHYQRFFLKNTAIEGAEDQDDIVIYDAMDGLNVYDANVGIYFYNHKLYAGFSVPNLVQARLNTIGTNFSTTAQLTRQYMVTAGYKFLPENSMLSVTPSILIRKVEGTVTQVDLTIRAGLANNKLFAAFTYGTSDIITITAAYQIMQEGMVAYSYDYSVGDLYQYTRGSHEISFIWEIGKENFRKLRPSKRYKG